MPGGPASSALLAEVRDKVRKAGVVLWIDSEGHYTRFVDAFEEAPSDFAYPVVGLRGSFLELMLALEHYCNGLQPEHLLVHLPALNKETVKETPIYELYKAGTVFEKNLATLVREASIGVARPEEVEAFVRAPGLDVAKADAWLEGLRAEPRDRLSLLCESLGVDDVALGVIADDPRIRAHLPEGGEKLLDYLEKGLGLSNAWRKRWIGESELGAADHLASTGAFAQAVEVAAALEEAEALVEAWTERALALGGTVRARMLARVATRHPDRLVTISNDIEHLLESPDTLDERVAIAETVMATSPPGRPESLAASVARALLADASARSDAIYATLAVELVRRANIRVERADLPPMPVFSERRFVTHGPELELTLHPADTGAFEVWDAAVLASGRLVLALGEAGIRVQTAAGKRIAHLDVPAHRIVPSDHGDRLLALAKRGKAWRVSRVDLIGRRGEPWTELRLEAFAPTFDGDSWAVAMRGDLLALDVLSHDVTALHSVPRLNLPVVCITRSRDAMSVILGDVDVREWWRFELPAWTLRFRIDPFRDHEPAIVATAEADLCASLSPDATLTLQSADFATPIDLPPSDVPELPHALCLSRAWLAATLTTPAGARVLLVNPHTQTLRGCVSLPGVHRAQTRISGGHLLIADDLGRLTTIDLTTGSARTQRVGVCRDDHSFSWP